MMQIRTFRDKKRFIFEPLSAGWIPHQYEETKQYGSFYKLRPEWTVVDVGAWIGLWTVWVASQVEKVYSLEPVPECFKNLKNNLKLNKISNVELSEMALFSESGMREMDVTGVTSASTMVDAWRFGAEHLYDGGRKIKVQTKTWDDWVNWFGIQEVNLVKIDVEGAELHVLSGMNKVLPERIEVAIYHLDAPLIKIMNILYPKGYILDGFGYYDCRAINKGKPHSAFFRRQDISYESPQRYIIGSYELPSRELMYNGLAFYLESMGVKNER